MGSIKNKDQGLPKNTAQRGSRRRTPALWVQSAEEVCKVGGELGKLYHPLLCLLFSLFQTAHGLLLSFFIPPRHLKFSGIIKKITFMFPPPVLAGWRKSFFRRQRSRHHRRRLLYFCVCQKLQLLHLLFSLVERNNNSYYCTGSLSFLFSPSRVTHSAMQFFAPLLFKEPFSHRVFLSAPPKWINPPLSLFCERTACTKENQHASFATVDEKFKVTFFWH